MQNVNVVIKCTVIQFDLIFYNFVRMSFYISCNEIYTFVLSLSLSLSFYLSLSLPLSLQKKVICLKRCIISFFEILKVCSQSAGEYCTLVGSLSWRYKEINRDNCVECLVSLSEQGLELSISMWCLCTDASSARVRWR